MSIARKIVKYIGSKTYKPKNTGRRSSSFKAKKREELRTLINAVYRQSNPVGKDLNIGESHIKPTSRKDAYKKAKAAIDIKYANRKNRVLDKAKEVHRKIRKTEHYVKAYGKEAVTGVAAAGIGTAVYVKHKNKNKDKK